ncbi:MAG: phosphohexomutase domain-containing protein [Candidatus Krumholzibacteriia bacterium]
MSASLPLFTPGADRAEVIAVTPALAARARLTAWAAEFRLGTAGWRDLLDPDDPHSLDVPFNSLTLALVLEARAQLALEEGLDALHVGGEVRPHTPAFIDLAARIYAGHGIAVHLRPSTEPTTPIWLSSFGVFREELAGGENFTASHSQNYKGGWKPMDDGGGQLLELADAIADRVRALAARAAAEGLEVRLAPAADPLIRRDFDPVDDYVAALHGLLPPALLDGVRAAAAAGFRAAFGCEGGSMGATARRVFAGLGLAVAPSPAGVTGGLDAGDPAGPVFFTHFAERSDYYGIGTLDGVNHGVDPGKPQVYKHVGAQRLLRDGRAQVFFLWDPDGDRFNMVTTAPSGLAAPAAAAGLEVDELDAGRCLVFFKPNQIYFMLTALRLESLREAGDLAAHDWIVATTWPTSRSIGELAEAFNRRHGTTLRTFRVPVGFKHFAAFVRDLEDQLADEDAGGIATRAVDVTGAETVFGPRPRLLIMAEESGGAALGTGEWLASRHDGARSLAPKEKDGMQVGVLALALAARLHREGGSFARYYLELLDRYEITHRFYERRDVILADESLRGAEREVARAAGHAKKEATVAFFRALEALTPAAAEAALRARLPHGAPLPAVRQVCWAGDGTLIEFDGQWFMLRASGTDAVLRYYMEGRQREAVSGLNAALAGLAGA